MATNARDADIGTRVAARAVIEDATALIRAEIALAKAELQEAARAKAMGAGLLAAAGILGWLGLQGVLITIAFGIAEAGLPGWAAAGIVTLVLLLIAGVLALVGRSRLQAKLSLDTTKQQVEEDVAVTKSHLPSKGA
jgi:TRAP-type C4-dicarboxylate transport system permease small subunit